MNPKLLIVDDDEDIRSQLKWALCQDYEVVLAEDRPSGLEAFRAQRPPVVLLDLGLPPNPGGQLAITSVRPARFLADPKRKRKR